MQILLSQHVKDVRFLLHPYHIIWLHIIGKFANLESNSYICPKFNFPWGAPH